MKDILKTNLEIEREELGDDGKGITRRKITNAVAAEIYSVVRIVNDELDEMDMEHVSKQEFTTAVKDVFDGLCEKDGMK